jgi:hypothetical protein
LATGVEINTTSAQIPLTWRGLGGLISGVPDSTISSWSTGATLPRDLVQDEQ